MLARVVVLYARGVIDKPLRNRLLLFGASLLALGGAWFVRRYVDAHHVLPGWQFSATVLAVLGSYGAGFFVMLRTCRVAPLWVSGPQRSQNLLRVSLAVLPFAALLLVGPPFAPEPLAPPAAARSGSHSWNWRERDGRYFVVIDSDTDRAVTQEISKAEYDQAMAKGARLFGTVLVFFGAASLCLAWLVLVWPSSARRTSGSSATSSR